MLSVLLGNGPGDDDLRVFALVSPSTVFGCLFLAASAVFFLAHLRLYFWLICRVVETLLLSVLLLFFLSKRKFRGRRRR